MPNPLKELDNALGILSDVDKIKEEPWNYEHKPPFKTPAQELVNTGQASPSNNVVLYLNGDPVLTTSVKRSNNNIQMVLGSGTSGSGNQFLSGKIASAMLYNRVLTATEVQQNYNATVNKFN